MELNPANERLKHRYFVYLKEARQLGEHSIDQVAKALDRFEGHTRRKSYRDFRTDQAISFKKHLGSLNSLRGAGKLSKATVTSTLYALRDFFAWLSEQKGFRNRMVRTDADFFSPLRSDEAISRAPRQLFVPTLDEVKAVLAAMPADTSVQRRDRALVAFTVLTGARDNATATVRLKHLVLPDRQLYQDAREMRTKFRKTFPTWFFPVATDFEAIVADWKNELETCHGFGPDDPLFPKAVSRFGPSGEVLAPTLARECWANAGPIRNVFKLACATAGQRHFTPHSIRHTLTQYAEDVCETPADFKAWSQNLGHDSALTTLTSYGALPAHKQRNLLAKLRDRCAIDAAGI